MKLFGSVLGLIAAAAVTAGAAAATSAVDAGMVFHHEHEGTVVDAYSTEAACEAARQGLAMEGVASDPCRETQHGGGVWWIGAPLPSWYLIYHR